MKSNENKRKTSTSDTCEGKKLKSNLDIDCSTSIENQQSDLTQIPVSESVTQPIENTNNVNKCSLTKYKSIGMEESLICNICQEIMYKCVSIQPCLHSYCAYCLLKWRKSGECCPSCRGVISFVSINHLVRDIIDKYLAQNPEKIKSIDERNEADLEVGKNMNILFSVPHNATSFASSSTNNCPLCNYPSNPIYTPSSINLPNYSCSSNSNSHTQCSCCHHYIPNLPSNNVYPSVSCEICNDKFCFLLLGSCTECVSGCLFTFRNFVFNTDLNDLNRVPNFIPDNCYETNNLRNYLNKNNLTVTDMYTQIFQKLSQGEISLDRPLVETSPLCLRCAKQSMLDLIYEYYVSIPRTDLDEEVTARPDCDYGKNCRTQRHQLKHCLKYNHACPQTKF